MATMMVGWLSFPYVSVYLLKQQKANITANLHMYKCQNHKVQKSFNGDVYRDGMHQS